MFLGLIILKEFLIALVFILKLCSQPGRKGKILTCPFHLVYEWFHFNSYIVSPRSWTATWWHFFPLIPSYLSGIRAVLASRACSLYKHTFKLSFAVGVEVFAVQNDCWIDLIELLLLRIGCRVLCQSPCLWKLGHRLCLVWSFSISHFTFFQHSLFGLAVG